MGNSFPLVLLLIITFNLVSSQTSSRKNIFGNRHEVFFLNLEDGYFGCQVNESVEFLQIYDLSRLCDGLQDCYMGSDELRKELKCTNDCDGDDGSTCSNGVCLDHQCHCNDGFGGCNCLVPDENECKYRPCDVFAHCTNTLGSFSCTCFPGYTGDGLHCEDIDECLDPHVAARCVENAECCNLPAHFACKCKPGYEGDGEALCTDIDECSRPGACGINTECINTPGNYSCTCRQGFQGNPYDGCVDIDECKLNPNACGPGAICTNLEGSYLCHCPDGFEGFDAQTTGCVDINECNRSPCSRSEECINEIGGYRCQQLINVNECLNNPCGKNAICTDTIGSFTCSCKPDYTGDPMKGCVDIDECTALEKPCGKYAICENASPGYNCKCLQGYRAVPDAKIACEQADVEISCHSNFDCTNNAECVDGQCFCQEGFEASGTNCVDIDECKRQKDICGPRAHCINIQGGYKCECEAGLIGTPPRLPCKEPCVNVECGPHAYCQAEDNEAFCICEKGWTFLPSDISKGCVDINECDASHGPFGMCGTNALCRNLDGSYECTCPSGFTGDANKQCYDIDECSQTINPCGENSVCQNEPGGFKCVCPDDLIAVEDSDPTKIKCIAVVSCQTNNDCPGNAICDAHKRCLCPEPNVGNDCRHPCEELNCGPNAKCLMSNGAGTCLCLDGYMNSGGTCIDVNECLKNPCAVKAICNNHAGGYTCQCPSGMSGDPYKGGCNDFRKIVSCSDKNPCPTGEKCVSNPGGANVCVCTQGHTRDRVSQQCRDVDECTENAKPACGLNALCRNLPGSYECICAEGYYGNPYEICEQCDSPECRCQPPYTLVGKNCILAGCSDKQKCPPGAECISITGGLSYCACPKGFRTQPDGSCVDIDECHENSQTCGYDAICQNTVGGFTCTCPPDYDGDPYHGLCSPAYKRCTSDNECGANEKCVQPGECICPPPFFVDAGNACTNPCERFACGINAKCTPTNPPQCMCEAGFKGDPLQGCDSIDECSTSPCAYGAQCINQKGGYLCQCPSGMSGDPYKTGCNYVDPIRGKTECTTNQDCASNLLCDQGSCISACTNLLCGPNAFCEPENHAGWCRCKVGFVEGQNGECVSRTSYQKPQDCRVTGCKEGECVAYGRDYVCKQKTGCRSNEECPSQKACINNVCLDVCGTPELNPCRNQDCQVMDHQAVCIKVCQCQKQEDCPNNAKCDGCNCIIQHDPIPVEGCEHCPPGTKCDVTTGACIRVCTNNENCSPNEACIDKICQQPCDVHSPCAQNAVCLNVNHGSDCVCKAGFEGNGYALCALADKKLVCQYNEDCPPHLYCDRLNRVCMNPCTEDFCGENAECYVDNHNPQCRCPTNYHGNAFVQCMKSESCSDDKQCPISKSCINGECVEPPCNCGPNAECTIEGHSARCTCPKGFRGDPYVGCNINMNPCIPSPCGKDALCELDGGNPICYCPKNMTGNPFDKCIPKGNKCSKNSCGPNSECIVVNRKVTCFCLPNYEGNPPRKPCQPPKNPCESNICGPNTQCSIEKNGLAKCSCLAGFIESPNTIRGCVESRDPCESNPCGKDAICDSSRTPMCFCPDNKRGNPYRGCEEAIARHTCEPDSCGRNANCFVTGNEEVRCECKSGFIGDPYVGCNEVPKSVCDPNPCGPGAQCIVSFDGKSMCICPEGTHGDPTSYEGCYSSECLTDKDCSIDKACIGRVCKNPCDGACGYDTHCIVERHRPVCSCVAGYTGNPYTRCYPGGSLTQDPCPKGSKKPECNPECLLNSDCDDSKACINTKCSDPCKNACGINTQCRVERHTPICQCLPNHMGDALIQCTLIKPDRDIKSDPCKPSPCPANVKCFSYDNKVAICDNCASPDSYNNPQCRPQCTTESECPSNMACINRRCEDPCLNSCGVNSECRVIGHKPNCRCMDNMIGNPYEGCKYPVKDEEELTCGDKICGSNAECTQKGRVFKCVCKKDYYGDPLVGCRPECTINSECPHNKACVRNRCINPCEQNICGAGARCEAKNHRGICTCLENYTGNAYLMCTPVSHDIPPPPQNPCGPPSPCGPYSKCTISGTGVAVCSCQPGMKGSPPSCQPECSLSSDCSQNESCIRNRCINPCSEKICGSGARCDVKNHNPICTCNPGLRGDPFASCTPYHEPVETHPCDPSTCGPYSICREDNKRPVCSCMANMLGAPPHCQPECILHSDCSQNQICSNLRCQDPCLSKPCGRNSVCRVTSHTLICSCKPGYQGDAFTGCIEVIEEKTPTKKPCEPNPCAINSQCSEIDNNRFKCSCIPPYRGDPYNTGCTPECSTNSDCPYDLSCHNYVCRDPCPGVCGKKAYCEVHNHVVNCQCEPGYVGNAFEGCKIEPITPPIPQNPCSPERNPCGPNSQCRESSDGRPVCSCLPEMRGSPPSCRPECSVNSDCQTTEACIQRKCLNPCKTSGSCGINSECRVHNHNIYCTCKPNYVGDPFVMCNRRVEEDPVKPCQPSPCGPNSQCREVNNKAICKCLPDMLGAPPNCRPECSFVQDCPPSRTCISGRCVDPCVGACGNNAVCTVHNHVPNCECISPQYKGDPYSGCAYEVPLDDVKPNPCNPSPCGSNTICKEQNGAGSCACLDDFFGDPYIGCRPECTTNAECPTDMACSNQKCKNPCLGVCGFNAECRVLSHKPLCTCIEGYEGEPTRGCTQREISTPRPFPCNPSPCGPNSQCREVNNQAVCTCLPNYIGLPPSCRPECYTSSDCDQDKSCVNQKCKNPCRESSPCAKQNSRCTVINHNPICTCENKYSGDPFINCTRILDTPPEPQNPCDPSPCGPYSQCRETPTRQAICSCLPNYVGIAPNCRPECSSSNECSNNLACINNRCIPPCDQNPCARNAECRNINHNPICTCQDGFEGDPTVQCNPIPLTTARTPDLRVCETGICGVNAECRERNGAAACFCLPNFFGDPYTGCNRECESNSDCKPHLACSKNYKCEDPCPGVCGINARCTVLNHIPTCECPKGMIGDPFSICRDEPITPKQNPCSPSPCGPYSQCKEGPNGQSICTCMEGYSGKVPNCRPECVSNSECPSTLACINLRCVDPCPNTCGINGRCEVRSHSPICSCREGYTGDPFVQCTRIPYEDATTPRPVSCTPNPCGPHSSCKIINNNHVCSCLPDMKGAPPNCAPECLVHSDCPPYLTCINNKCKDPCVGSCTTYSECKVVSHTPICSCMNGYTGDPFISCSPVTTTTAKPIFSDPCDGLCGPNANCNNGVCTCISDYQGDPYKGCRPECTSNIECPRNKACMRNRCVNPCVNICGENAICEVVNHLGVCSCPEHMEGNPFVRCIPKREEVVSRDPCQPSPCGPYSQCRVNNNQAVCSCIEGYIGSAPNCRPECILSSECPQTLSCINSKCVDPCVGACGVEARCEVRNHSPICSCKAHMTGDPFKRCYEKPTYEEPVDRSHPCVPSPCGPNSQCRESQNRPICSCQTGYFGNPPNCRPECSVNADCPSDKICDQNKCINPCPSVCGENTECKVIAHSITCNCQENTVGDPFYRCTPVIKYEEPISVCDPSPCGYNAECIERNGVGSCRCIQDHFGDPYQGCRPECVTSSDCILSLACINSKCKNPCLGACVQNSECQVVNHVPSCSCKKDFEGDPLVSCTPVYNEPVTRQPENPCNPSPCGPYSQCKVTSNNHPVCTCIENYIGSPPNCKPECVVNSECRSVEACINNRCKSPCRSDLCGKNAECEVRNHSPVCKCRDGYEGNPFVQCKRITIEHTPLELINPCLPSPCGPNSQCRESPNGQAICSCLPNMIGSPPSCRPQCVVNSDCPQSEACINQKCQNPCLNACSYNSECSVQNHIATCECTKGYTGNAFEGCVREPTVHDDPCNPSPCGRNAICDKGNCYCNDDYIGDPYVQCRPECTLSTECPSNKACVRNHCVDPCVNVCAPNAICSVYNHIPTCNCPNNMIGDPFTQCRVQDTKPDHPKNPCQPSPCGPNSQCKESSNGHAICSCLSNMIGSPPSCRPECVINSECDLSKSCKNNKCVDPCGPGTCGVNARCQVRSHSPICTCMPGYNGDPFNKCELIQEDPLVPKAPCTPNPCGPNSECREISGLPACSCLSGFVGAPPNCRPECLVNSDCPNALACMKNKCGDPCVNACGLNAICSVVNHNPICNCIEGFKGNPFYSCEKVAETQDEYLNPCHPNPCGYNAECIERNGVGSCVCKDNFFGDPYESCRPECVLNADCPSHLACVNSKCKDTCAGSCGINSECRVVNHVANCICISGYTGNPYSNCYLIQEEPTPSQNKNPCHPSPCGPNSQCKEGPNGQPICSCLPTMTGSPPSCRPECVSSSECDLSKACKNNRCIDPCSDANCGINSNCRVISHAPICSCKEKYQGDPFVRCYPEEPKPKPNDVPINPCFPSPCGPNSQCREGPNGQAICSCLPNMIGSAPSCRPECTTNSECIESEACINQKCQNPCLNACSYNSECRVQNHIATCVCAPGYTGNAFESCNRIIEDLPKDPCNPSPCGRNAVCKDGNCYCNDDYIGDPYVQCRPECTLSTECPSNKACVRNHCVDPCLNNVCAPNAICSVHNHVPNCNCPDNMIGDPFIQCRVQDVPAPQNPCYPSPCGPNSQCREGPNGQPICSCSQNMIGSPPSCRPECVISPECEMSKACKNNKCVDPCGPGVCGINARCQVKSHSPICTCLPGYNGDPFIKCEITRDDEPTIPKAPCTPNPCGPNSICREISGSAACSCLEGYLGAPPNCRPECLVNSDCPNLLACMNKKCADPCINACGLNAKCSVINHNPVCTCIDGYKGDPFYSCEKILEREPTKDPCTPSPCGSNTYCKISERGSYASCICIEDYFGDPYTGCRPECVTNTDCPSHMTCENNKCKNPCTRKTCALEAECRVLNHIVNCQCRDGLTGDPYTNCYAVPIYKEPVEKPDVCYPSPCGINTICKRSGNSFICECAHGYFGNAYGAGCKPECTVNADCPLSKSCSNYHCIDPCINVCGYNARCNVINHNPFCTCPDKMIGDPFVGCTPALEIIDLCYPSPCKQNGICRVVNNKAVCHYPECVQNEDCPSNKACFTQMYCGDPCANACGENALCNVINHKAVCSCPRGFMGTPFVKCYVRDDIPTPKPECVSDDECHTSKTCINNKCVDPCSLNNCGNNAKCYAHNHRSSCVCPEGLTGNAFVGCYELGCRSDNECSTTEACINRDCIDQCRNIRCGENAICKTENHRSRCHCYDGYYGNPNQKCEYPECKKNDDCPYDLSCVNNRCVSPCSSKPCGLNAECKVNYHNSICTCPPGYTGDPFKSCVQEKYKDPGCTSDAECPSNYACFEDGNCKNACDEIKPCGLNAKCKVENSLPVRTMVCECLPGYEGNAEIECKKPPKYECQSDAECRDTDICRSGKCKNACSQEYNPCAPTAECLARNHRAECKCKPGLIGDPFVRCVQQDPPKPKPECQINSDCPLDKACISERCQDACIGVCGINAECHTNYHRAICTCPPSWAGDPHERCYKPECIADQDCPYDKACISSHCVNPCSYGTVKCGRGAECVVHHHRATCECPKGTQGDAMISCIIGLCQYNEDCADHETCDRLNHVCRPVCNKNSCGLNAYCEGINHAAKCQCNHRTRGNPYVECLEEKTPSRRPECTKDVDCPSQLACISEKCQNPCTEQRNICSRDQTCTVLDTTPLRTMVCKCPPDTVSDVNGNCVKIIRDPQCSSDNDCPNSDVCRNGNCILACRDQNCGVNAQCLSQNHKAICSCPPKYNGNPYVECSYRVIDEPIYECYSHEECPSDRICNNGRCTNPCQTRNACGDGAFCYVERHQVYCRCPEKFNGNPNILCSPVDTQKIGCKSVTDCTPNESCINERCVSPCNCGENSDCLVQDHIPICRCKAGFTGNPISGCKKVGCASDDECPNDLTCYNNEKCINPCLINDPCALSASCYGSNHRAACKCPPGLEGNPFERCERVECYSNNDCPYDHECQNKRCINICREKNPCAPNAICTAQNHVAACHCPDYLSEGSPYTYCYPKEVKEPVECEYDGDCPNQRACINNHCVNPCEAIKPCSKSSICTVHDTLPVRTMICSCPEKMIPDDNGECKRIKTVPEGCASDDECSDSQACISGTCRNPCNCGENSECHVQKHKPICSCKEGYEGNPNIRCLTIGCRSDSECDHDKACINSNCINPCLTDDPCASNAECYSRNHKPECRCANGFRGDPFKGCQAIECLSNDDCPSDKFCDQLNGVCLNPCHYDRTHCGQGAICIAQNHNGLCKCNPGLTGNPYVVCKLDEPRPECLYDVDCDSTLACIDGHCKEPCLELNPCVNPSKCQALATIPVRTILCVCPEGYISSGSGTCKPVDTKVIGCVADSDCAPEKSCINNLCREPCNCGPNAECRVKGHKPICTCKQGYEGNPEIGCVKIGCLSNSECASQYECINRQCSPVCKQDTCGRNAECIGINHKASCLCEPGFTGDPSTSCVRVECQSDSECPSSKACINHLCVDPCEKTAKCALNEICTVFNHRPECTCDNGFTFDNEKGCILREEICHYDGDCPSQTACIGGQCLNPCESLEPCGVNAVCKVIDSLPVRTMICECLPGYQGNAAIQCDLQNICPPDRILNERGQCICLEGTALNIYGECVICETRKGYKIENDHCVCALERGMIIDERGNCICPEDHGYQLTINGECVPVQTPECERNEDCPDNRYCEQSTKTCEDPCLNYKCGINAFCNATNHAAKCDCIAGYVGDPDVRCNDDTHKNRSDFPRPALMVKCLADGVLVQIDLIETGFNGVLYVKGHSKEEECRRVISLADDNTPRVETFKVHFGSCGLFHINGLASFVLVIQKHPKLVTYKAQAYHIRCVYQTGEQNVTLGFNVQMLTTAGTIANTGPPPQCTMRIVHSNGNEINSAEIGDNLMLQVEVQPATIYGGFARTCVAKTMEESVENEYIVTDENGCATDPSIFGEWEYNADSNTLMARFNAFKFPSSDNIRFQCNIRVCFGKCQPVNCRGYNAFGRRKRREITNNESQKENQSISTRSNNDDVGLEGTLREEITISSNAILTFEKRDGRYSSSDGIKPAAQRVEDICVSMIGLIIALIITALLALVAVAIAVSCWLMAYRRKPKTTGPLSHPAEIPNPIFTTENSMNASEPIPDYLS